MNVNIQSPMFQYSIFLSKDSISCLEYLSDNQGNVIIFADSYDVGNNGSLNFYRISSAEGKNIKIPIYSIPASHWISVVLINEDQRQVLFEEEPSFDYEFDDLDLIRNRNLQNPFFIEKEPLNNQGFSPLSDIDNEFNENSLSKHNSDSQNSPMQENQVFSPVINIQNILPDNYQQTLIQSNPQSDDNYNNDISSPLNSNAPGRISVTDEQMNGLLSAIDKLTNLFVTQQQNFNKALEMQGQQIAIQGQHFLQMQPIIEKLITQPTMYSGSNNLLNPSSDESLKKNNKSPSKGNFKPQELQTLLNNIPKSIKPFMPNISSGLGGADLSTMIESLQDKPSKNTNTVNLKTSIPLNEDIGAQKANEEQPNNSSHDHQIDNDKQLNALLNEEDPVSEHDTENSSIIEEPTKYEGDEAPVSSELSDDNISTLENPSDTLNEEEKQALQSINAAIDIADVDDDDISNLVSAIEVIQNDEHEFNEELKEIVQETNELLQNKDILHFDKRVEHPEQNEQNQNFSPSGALEHDLEDEISKLSAQAEDILSRNEHYDNFDENSSTSKHSQIEKNNDSHTELKDDELIINEDYTDHAPAEDVVHNPNVVEGAEGNDAEESDNNDNLLDLLNTMENDSNTSNVEFEPIPDDVSDEDQEEGEGGESQVRLDIDSQNPTAHNEPHSAQHDEASVDDLDIYSMLNATSDSPTNNKHIEDESISTKINSVTSSRAASEKSLTDDFSLDQLDNLEALIQPASKKGKSKAIVDDSENQDEFVSSQVLSYVFSDLDEDEFFEVNKFLAYFEENNLHKAFGKINKDKVIYLVCKLLKNKNASPSKFVRPSIQKKLKTIMPDVAKEHWTGSITNIMDVFEAEKLLDGVNEIDICVWFVKNNFF